MEFHIRFAGSAPDPARVEEAIRSLDPSALVDVDPASPTLRVATSIGARQLVALVGQAGYPVALQQVAQRPSICCGGCSG